MNQLDEQTRHAVEEYWSTDLGCAPEHFHSTHTLVVPDAERRSYHAIYCFHHQQSLLISVPPELLVNMRAAAVRLTAKTLADAMPIALLAGARIERAIGPATIDYADRGTVRLRADPRARLLNHNDEAAIERLRAACTALEWEHGGSEGSEERAGVFVGDVLAALASYQVWGERLCTHRDCIPSTVSWSGFRHCCRFHACRCGTEARADPSISNVATQRPIERHCCGAGFHPLGNDNRTKVEALER